MPPPDLPATEPSQRPMRWGWIFGVIWLVYLGDPLGAALDHPPGAVRDVGVAAVLAFAAAYVWVMVRGRGRRLLSVEPGGRLAWVQLGVLAALLVAMVPAAQEHAFAAWVFVSAAAMLTLPIRQAWVVVLVLTVGAELALHLVPGWSENGSGLGIVLAAVAVFAIRVAFDRNRRLLQAQDEMAQLAVSAERSRFARDLHDILGHSLTVITVKAELAARVLRDDPDRAAAEIADVERLSRDALADVRRAVAGYREVTLTTELASARQSLGAAGIDADISAAVDDVASERRELYGWVVREGVTNVIRHSDATRCVIRADASGVEVVDDGIGPATQRPSAGHGLLGLTERATAAGARITTGRAGPAGGFRLRLTVEPDGSVAAHRPDRDPERAARR